MGSIDDRWPQRRDMRLGLKNNVQHEDIIRGWAGFDYRQKMAGVSRLESA